AAHHPPGVPQHLDDAVAEARGVQQAEQEQGGQRQRVPVDEVDLLAGDFVDGDSRSLQDEEGTAEGQRKVARQEPADAGAEGQGAESLQPAQVNLATAIDAVKSGGEATVSPDEAVAGEELGWPG